MGDGRWEISLQESRVWVLQAATNGVFSRFLDWKSAVLLANPKIVREERAGFSATKSVFFKRVSLQV
jgi:hypothetical protein